MKISKRNPVLSLLLTFTTLCGMQAQTFSGKIVTDPNNEAVPFANVMIKGSTFGVASDEDGNFAITIPDEYKNETLLVSAVGYTEKEMPISELSKTEVNTIVIKQQNYNIDEVDVESESKVLYGAIKKCSKNVANNYINSPYSCDFTYTDNHQSAKGIITDARGYQRSSNKSTYKKITYQFTPTEKEKPNKPFFEGKTNMEDLLSFDLVRTVGNIIDEHNVYDFELNLIPNNTDPDLWVIHFKNNDPQLYNTGDAHTTTYEGELYIKKDSYAIIKTVVRGTSDKRSIHGKSIIVGEQSSNYVTDLSYEVTTTYKAKNGKYRMDKIKMSESFVNTDGQKQELESSLTITGQKADFADIKGRDYYIK